jgi:hypothetical protein
VNALSGRARILLVVAVTIVVGGAAAAYVVSRVAEQQAVAATPPAEGSVTTLADLAPGPVIVFRNTALDSLYGRLAVVSAADPQGPRAVLDASCERVSATADGGICLSVDRGVVTTGKLLTLDPDLRVTSEEPLTGLPSRVRMSGDGRLVATTTFVSGHSYSSADFSTETLVRRRGGDSYGNLEKFDLYIDGTKVTAADRNLWGVTFTDDDDTFYATAKTGGQTWLVRGSLSQRRLDSITDDAECPSLSPDGTRVVYKKREGAPSGQWRLALYDLASGTETPIGEDRNVDDQVIWLDDDRIAYGINRPGSDAAITDVWAIAVGGAAEPEMLVPQAWSPSLVERSPLVGPGDPG